MNRNGGLIAILLAALAVVGVSNFPKAPEAPAAASGKQASSEKGKAPAATSDPSEPCKKIGDHVQRLLEPPVPADSRKRRWPKSCYQGDAFESVTTPVHVYSGVRFLIATVPNPETTHLPLFFDRIVESVQQAAQDNEYSYDGSWFPWELDRKEYTHLEDQTIAEALKDEEGGQPGVMVFRHSNDGLTSWKNGLIVFLVGEQPTGGINDEQFRNAVEWIDEFDCSGSPLQILGPAFSGSADSLLHDLDQLWTESGPRLPPDIYSGSATANDSYQHLKEWTKGKGGVFATASQPDDQVQKTLCDYLDKQGYEKSRIAFLSEDETAFGGAFGRTDKPSLCPDALEFYYPRDIATLRSAYESQAILAPPKPQANAPASSLRRDLLEPDHEHDSVHHFGGSLTALAQESVLLSIANRLQERAVQFVVVRSTNSLDQIFLGQFLHRAYPAARLVMNGSDLLFARGSDGASLNGALLLSSYPLLTPQLDWTGGAPGNPFRNRIFGEDMAEGVYIAAFNLIGAKPPPVSPCIWLTVVGHRRFWPIAELSGCCSAGPTSWSLPTPVWLTVMACFLWSCFHLYFCRSACIRSSPRARAYFVPVSAPQHPALIALGTTVIVMTAIVLTLGSGLQLRPVPVDRAGVLAAFLSTTVAVSFLACACNYLLEPVRFSQGQHRRQILSALCASIGLLLFVGLFEFLDSKLVNENRLGVFLRSIQLTSGVSPLLPKLLLLAGAYVWFWFNLRGLSHFGGDRPILPSHNEIALPAFSKKEAGDPVESLARPLNRHYVRNFGIAFLATVGLMRVALQDFSIRNLGDWWFGALIFFWTSLYIAVILADGVELWGVWSKHRELLTRLDALPLRRALRALNGIGGGTILKMSGGAAEEWYRMTWRQVESLRHLINLLHERPFEPPNRDERRVLLECLDKCGAEAKNYASWLSGQDTVNGFPDYRKQVASTVAMVMNVLLIPAWKSEKESLLVDPPKDKGTDSSELDELAKVPEHIKAAEEFVALLYVGFIQNIVARIRTMALGGTALFVALTLAIASYPFEPLDRLSLIFLAVFIISGGLSVLVYAQMSRDATLSHITNTTPGELGWEFWEKLVAFGIGPLLTLMTTLFPSIGDFVFSWIQPSAQALK